jgi:hypothetical protein
MTLHDALARRLDPNAVAPYRWEADYRDGSTVRQFDPVRGFQPSTVLDPRQVVGLRILGHPYGPIRMALPYPDRVPDEVRIQATTDMAIPVDGTQAEISMVRWFGFRYGSGWSLLRIDDAGRLAVTDRFE